MDIQIKIFLIMSFVTFLKQIYYWCLIFYIKYLIKAFRHIGQILKYAYRNK